MDFNIQAEKSGNLKVILVDYMGGNRGIVGYPIVISFFY